MNEITTITQGSVVASRNQEMAGELLAFIRTAATDPSVEVTKLQALLDMQDRVLAKQAIADFHAAFARLPAFHVKRNGLIDMGSKGSMKFATWQDMYAVIMPHLEANGFRLSFDSVPNANGGGMVVTGKLLHVYGGHFMTASIPLALDTGAGRNNLQAMGSTLSYGKRYTTEMLLNIVRDLDDDDGKIGGIVYINNDQIKQIEALLTETKSDEVAFLRWMNCDSIDQIEDGKPFTAAINSLNTKKSKMRTAP